MYRFFFLKSWRVETYPTKVTSRTEQFIAMNEKKEAELEKQRKVIQNYEVRMANNQLQPEKQQIKQLSEELEMAHKKYAALEAEMRDVAVDMEQNNELITKLTDSSSPEMQIRELMAKYEFLNREHAKLHEVHDTSMHTHAQTEINLREVEEQLTRERKLRQEVESGIVGVPELRVEIDKLEKKLLNSQNQCADLTQGIGNIDDKLLLMMAENDKLRSDLGMGPRDDSDLAELRHNLQISNRTQKADLMFLEKQVNELENERIELKRQLRLATQTIYQRSLEYGLTPEQFDKLRFFESTIFCYSPWSK